MYTRRIKPTGWVDNENGWCTKLHMAQALVLRFQKHFSKIRWVVSFYAYGVEL
jgi:hypothetical protein